MSNEKVILDFLCKAKDKQYCDDCLFGLLKIYPRQQVNQIARFLSNKASIYRERGSCSTCGKYKILNRYGEAIPHPIASSLPQEIVHEIPHQGERLEHDIFEQRVAHYLANKFGKIFSKHFLSVGPNKFQNFDLISEDKTIVVECKSYTWTTSGNFPSAKVSTAIETLLYFSRIVTGKKILVFQDHINSQGESLVDIFVRRYDGVMDDVEVWAYTVGDSIENDRK